MASTSIPNEDNSTKQGELVKSESSILLSVAFAGLGTGFISFWLTLTVLYSGILCLIGAPIVWFFVRGMKGDNIANRSVILYLVCVLIGIGVGYASSAGSGVPVYFT